MRLKLNFAACWTSKIQPEPSRLINQPSMESEAQLWPISASASRASFIVQDR
jgi:hypothetical protein